MTVYQTIPLATLIFSLVSIFSSASGGAAQDGACSATFVAGATMEKDFTGKATSRVCRVTYRTEASVRVLDLDVEFAWADVSTAHDKRDQRMRDHFGKSGFPTIRGIARGMPVPALRNAGPDQPVTLPITLVLGGVSNQVHGLVTNQMSRVGELDLLDVEFKISQEKFGYDPITLLGFMSVRDEVAVQVRFSLPPDPGAPPSPADR